MAFATPVPELLVTIAAIQLGAGDMAIGNLLGSNLSGMFVVAIDDLFFTSWPILGQSSPVREISAMLTLVMTGPAIVVLYYRPRKHVLRTAGCVGLALCVLSAERLCTLHGW